MLVYLAMNPGPHERQKLMGLLWSDFSEVRARRNLRHSLWNLRSQLDARLTSSVLLTEGDAVAFNHRCDYWLDVEAVRHAALLCASAQERVTSTFCKALRAAIDVYRGDFLEGFYVDDALLFEEWALLKRAQLQGAARQVLQHLVRHHVQEGDYKQAEACLRRLLSLDPCCEDVHRQLMALLSLRGQRSAALHQYRICRQVLSRELDTSPLEETVALYGRIRDGILGRLDALALLSPTFQPERSGTRRQPSCEHLPAPTTAFFGREAELAAVVERLGEPGCRLLTITGPPGVGKTRLALEAGTRLATLNLPIFRDGVYFVSLAALTTPDDLVPTMAEVLGLKPSGQTTIGVSLRASLRKRALLLILDNFEHLMDAALWLSDLLAACRHLKVLVTSREVLRLHGEHEFPVSPFSLPAHAQSTEWEALKICPAVALFVDRARAARHDFRLTPENATTVLQLCRRLDGLPLGIELAAARIRTLSPARLLELLSGPEDKADFHLLVSRVRDLPDRHKTLYEAVSWSYQLLSAREQALFRCLGVFSGSCSFQGIEVVCGSPSESSRQLLDHLSSLARKHLIQHDEREVQIRFHMYAVLREFALEQLADQGEAEAARRRYVHYYVDLASSFAESVEGRAAWMERIAADVDNFRSVLHRLLEHEQGDDALVLTASLWPFWGNRGHPTEGQRWIEAALSLPNQERFGMKARAKALYGASVMAYYRSDYQATTVFARQSLRLNRRMGHKAGAGAALSMLAGAAEAKADYERAEAFLRQNLALLREIDAPRKLSTALCNLATVAYKQGRLEEARSWCEEGLVLARDRGHDLITAHALRILATLSWRKGDLDRASAFVEESLELLRALEDQIGLSMSLEIKGKIAHAAGDDEEAEASYRQSLVISLAVDEKSTAIDCLTGLAQIAADRGEEARATRLLAASTALCTSIGLRLPPHDRRMRTTLIQDLKTRLDTATFDRRWNEGFTLTFEEAVALALNGRGAGTNEASFENRQD